MWSPREYLLWAFPIPLTKLELRFFNAADNNSFPLTSGRIVQPIRAKMKWSDLVLIESRNPFCSIPQHIDVWWDSDNQFHVPLPPTRFSSLSGRHWFLGCVTFQRSRERHFHTHTYRVIQKGIKDFYPPLQHLISSDAWNEAYIAGISSRRNHSEWDPYDLYSPTGGFL